jgi:hypothetical protein
MTKKTLMVAVVGLLIAAATATALKVRAGDLILNADGGFSPTVLPKHEDAPITLHGGGNLSTVSGELPPIAKELTIEFDRHGHVETRGLPVCHGSQLEATTVAQARRNCSGSIVGEGFGKAMIAFPEQRPIPVSSPITLFNGPRKHGQPTVYAHAFITVPAPVTYIVPIVIERINHGVYGYRTKARIPKIAGGAGHGVSLRGEVGHTWTFKGHKYSYVNARCETGHLQAKVKVSFEEGIFLTGTFAKPCTVRH